MPFADQSLIPVPTEITDDDAAETLTLLSDIFPTAWQALDFAGFQAGDSVAVFGAGPVGLLTSYLAVLRGATRVYTVDQVRSRLNLAKSVGAVPINFVDTDPVAEILRHEPNGVDRSVDCVGLEAEDRDGNLDPGVVLRQSVEITKINGGIGQVGAYNLQTSPIPGTLAANITDTVRFPLSKAWSKSIRLQGGPVDPRAVVPQIMRLVLDGTAKPHFIHTATINISQAPEYYRRFSAREEVKVFIRFDW